MTFEEVLNQAIAMLRRQGRVSYRALKRQFGLDDDYLADLKAEIIAVHQVAVDQDGTMLVWTGGTSAAPSTPLHTAPPAAPHVDHPTTDVPPAGAPRPPSAARRQLTVLFCDLVDSTALSSQLDPEDYREVVRAYQEASAAVIQRFDGSIAQYLGDGLLVYFGYPQAHEDDAQRAVRASLGIVEALGALNARLESHQGVRLAVRLGIHTGLVVVGEMGGGTRQEQLALGETPNVAARLQGLAAPDTVLVSAATYRLIAGFFMGQALGVHTLRGVAEPVSVYQILGESAAQSRLEIAGSSGLTPLVGRAAEVTLLLERWAQSAAGQGQVVLLSGEAGIGKSRLVEVMRQHVVSEGAQRLVFRCSPYHTSSALYPVIEQVQRVLQWHRDDAPETQLDALEQVLQTHGFPLPEVVPLLAALLSVPLLDRYPPLTLTPQRQRQQTLETLAAWFLAAAERQPVLAVWEDLHWADPSTLELLGLLLDQTPTTHMLTLLTCRPEFHQPWATHSYLTQLTLGRLGRPQVEEMVTRLTGGKPLPAEVVEQIVAKTDGVPLFVEELVKMLLESGLMQEEAARYVLTGPLPPLAIPTTLQDSLMARLDRLGPARDLAQLAAVLGREFAYEVLRAVAPLDETALQQALGRLVDAEVLYQRGLPPRASYIFKHALIQEAAYQSLLRRTRQQAHQHITQVLETHFPETVETQPELLAHHCTAAGLHTQAVEYWRMAGQRATARSAYWEAVANFEQALGALQLLPENPDTMRQRIDLHFNVRVALHSLNAYAQILPHLREAERLAEALGDSQRLARCLAYLGNYFTMTFQYAQAIEVSQRALALATAHGDVALQLDAQYRLSHAYFNMGDFQQVITLLTRIVESLTGDLEHAFLGYSAPLSVVSRELLVYSLASCGAFAEGLTQAKEAARIAAAIDHSWSHMFAAVALGWLSLTKGDFTSASAAFERCHALGERTNIPTRTEVTVALGLAYARSGRVTQALPLVEQAMERYQAMTGTAPSSSLVASVGQVYLLAGRLDEAMRRARQALDLSHERQEYGTQAYALQLLGEITVCQEPRNYEQAKSYYCQALDLATEHGMRPRMAHCHRGLGTLYARMRQVEQARTELSAAIELYRTMEMTFWLPQAEAALAQVGNAE